ncbi:hypothetical protein [Butyrivibrio sp. YAB3001]|uniref:hypothetical protein n=1 Tax=Butyrivibrio sp. YAB3001 TaxID=1520812 RepID=UPI0008F61E23|nr:hypothetical protein [Butyrivibrio sp. YAB3001]SFD00432.1 hypothetical protein SAMN02910398_03759 [Butyrivibrio sp. YAB3001]
MGVIFAKVKDKDEPIRRLLYCDDLYNIGMVMSSIDYSTDVLLEDNQWFKIGDFSNKGYTNHFIGIPVDTTYPVGKIDINKVQYICTYQETGCYFYQRVIKSRILTNTKLLSLKDDATLIEKQDYIVLTDEPDAIYCQSKDTLYFKDIARITPIFGGLEKLFKEATREEVTTFVDSVPVELNGKYDIEHIGKLNRQRITKAMTILEKLNQDDREKIFTYTNDYSGLSQNCGKFVISNEEEMKAFLFGIDQRYYTTPIGNERRVANSIIALPEK